ncbi:DUF6896 domain-containing protein [Mucilaginibacter sp. AW1-3]
MSIEITLLDVIKDYQETVDKAVTIFKNKYKVDNILEGWHTRKYKPIGKIRWSGIRFYAFHGIGLTVHFRDKIVDFDFAFFPELRHDGFDIWRLAGFVKGQLTKYQKYLDENVLKSDFNDLIARGVIYNPVLERPTLLYFFV